jgi:6-pyruvoyl-tetrahydropterin synthase
LQGGRERLHGHNYRASISIRGRIGSDGYVIDFKEVKSAVRTVCASLDERFLCPTACPAVTVALDGGSVTMTVVADGSRFVFPADDVALLPLCNSTVEELARYIAGRLLELLRERLVARGVVSMTVGVAESANQEARYTTAVR